MLNRRGRVSRPFNFSLSNTTDRGFLCSAKKIKETKKKVVFFTRNNVKCNKDVTMCGYNIMHGRVSFRYSADENKVCRGSNPLFNGIEPAAGRRR